MTTQSRPRLNEGLWRSIERPLLRWLANHVPRWVTPDHLTAVGLLGSLISFFSYLFSSWHPHFLWLASGGLIVNWFGDSLDGTVARLRKIERPRYGFFVDHTTDLFAEVLFATGLGLTPYVRFEVACLALVGYLFVAAYTFIRLIVFGVMQIAYHGIGPTEVRVGMIVLNTWMVLAPPKTLFTLWAPLSPIDLIILVSSVSVFIFLVVSVRRDALHLANEDPRGPAA